MRCARQQSPTLHPPTARCADASCVSLTRFKREWPRGKSLHLRLMFGSAVRTLKAQNIRPDAGQGRVVNAKLKINRLLGLMAPTNETRHRFAHKSQLAERFLRNTFDADAQMVGDESADLIGDKGFFDSNRLFSRRPATHISPHPFKYVGMQSSNPPRSVVLLQNCKSVAI